MSEIILINVSGEDKPGLTTSISQILSNYNINILDIGQAVIHDDLALGILIEVPRESESSPVLKDILFKAHEMGIKIRFSPITENKYEKWVSSQGKKRNIITLLAKKITAEHIAKVTAVVTKHGLNIDNISRLSGRVSLKSGSEQNKSCIEFSLRGEPDNPKMMKGEFLQIANLLNVDIAFYEENMFRRNRRLVVFDMDSTLIESEVIDELAKAAGVGQKVAKITEKAMNGQIDFKESFTQRVALLKGLDRKYLKTIADNLPLSEGAEKLLLTLKKLGYKTAIISGGFDYFGRYLQQKFAIDYVYANQLEIKNNKATGNVVGRVIDGERKKELLEEIVRKEGISLEQVIAVGDGANDLPMLSIAGLGIAFRAKQLVKENAKQSISALGLDGILYLIGFRDRDHLKL